MTTIHRPVIACFALASASIVLWWLLRNLL